MSSEGVVTPLFEHPCLKCGACCAHFRVSFYWQEHQDPGVPEELSTPLNSFFSCMKGTQKSPAPRCVALNGEIGKSVYCSIYPNRSTTCQNFKASFEDGLPNEMCDRARARHGLNPLGPEDWKPYTPPGTKDPFPPIPPQVA